MNSIIIWGNTPLSAVVAEYINETADHEVVAFTVDKDFINGMTLFEGLPLLPFEEIEKYYSPSLFQILVTVTSGSKARFLNEKKCNESIKKGFKLFTFIHPDAYIAKSAKIGSNCIICPKVVVEPRAIINNGVFIRSAAYVSHDTFIGEYTYLAPGATLSGLIKTGRHCFFGTNSTVRDKIIIGNSSIIGAGAVILKNVGENVVIKAAKSEIMNIDRNNIII